MFIKCTKNKENYNRSRNYMVKHLMCKYFNLFSSSTSFLFSVYLHNVMQYQKKNTKHKIPLQNPR